jgi:hypothetical protein
MFWSFGRALCRASAIPARRGTTCMAKPQLCPAPSPTTTVQGRMVHEVTKSWWT